MTKDLTRGSLFGKMLQFAIPYLIASFLQTFYGMADLFITGQFNGAAAVSAATRGRADADPAPAAPEALSTTMSP